jgi:hypothetical protein
MPPRSIAGVDTLHVSSYQPRNHFTLAAEPASISR